MECRATSLSARKPIQTTLRGARAAARAMGLLQEDKLEVKTVQGCRPCGGGEGFGLSSLFAMRGSGEGMGCGGRGA